MSGEQQRLRIAITGGTSGLGLALVRELSSRGALVAFVARHREGVERVVRERPEASGIVGDVSRPEVVRLLPKVFSGGHVGHPKVDIRRARTVRVEGPADTYVQVDGEVVGTLPAEFGVQSAALRVIAPAAPTGA